VADVWVVAGVTDDWLVLFCGITRLIAQVKFYRTFDSLYYTTIITSSSVPLPFFALSAWVFHDVTVLLVLRTVILFIKWYERWSRWCRGSELLT